MSSITFTFVATEAVSGIVNVIESHSPFVRKRKQQHQGEMCTVSMSVCSHRTCCYKCHFPEQSYIDQITQTLLL